MKNLRHGQNIVTRPPSPGATLRSEALATRPGNGARGLTAFSAACSEAESQMRLPNDGRKIGVTEVVVTSIIEQRQRETRLHRVLLLSRRTLQ